MILVFFAVGCRNVPYTGEEVEPVIGVGATHQVTCTETDDSYSFLSTSGLANGTVFIDNPWEGGINPDDPTSFVERPHLLPQPVAVNQSGLIHLEYMFTYISPSPMDWDVVQTAQIFHVPNSATPIPYGTPVCTLHPSSATPGGYCTHQLEPDEIGVEQVYKSRVVFNDGHAPRIAYGYITAPGAGMGLPFAEISYFETTPQSHIKVSFDWVENNEDYGEIIQLMLFNETTGQIVADIDHLYGDHLDNGSTILDELSNNFFVDTSPANGANTYLLRTYYWGSSPDDVVDQATYTLNTDLPDQDYPKAHIVGADFNDVNQTTLLNIDILEGDLAVTSITNIEVTNQSTGTTLCTFTANIASVSGCVDNAPLINQENEYRITSTYLNSLDEDHYTQVYFHTPHVVYDPDPDNPDPGTSTDADQITLFIYKDTGVTLVWNVMDFANHADITNITVGKFEGSSGYLLSQGLSVDQNQTDDPYWRSGVAARYMLNVGYTSSEEKLYQCEEITF